MPDAHTVQDGPSLDQIIEAVVDEFGVSRMNLVSDRREAGFVRARHVAMWLARSMTPLTYPQIGRGFGGRDHTTVMHAVGAVDARLAIDPKLAERVRSVRAAIERQAG